MPLFILAYSSMEECFTILCDLLGLNVICVSPEIVFEIPQEIKPIQVEPSRTIEIVCETPDETTPATWYKDDVQLTPDGVKYDTASKERKRSLVLHDVKPEDAGQYVCEVGPHRTVTTLEVTKPEEKEIKGSHAFRNFAANLYARSCWHVKLFKNSSTLQSVLKTVYLY